MIIVQLSGGLGNQMFQYAFGRFLSLKYKTDFKLDAFMLSDKSYNFGNKNYAFRNYSLGVFNIKADVARQRDIPFLFRRYFSGFFMFWITAIRRKFFSNPGQESFFHFDESKLLLGQNVYLEGYWQSYRYFDQIEKEIHEDFTLKYSLSGKMKELFEEISSCNSVCVHVRRTDYVGNNYYESLSNNYYNNAVKYINEIHPIDKIYVFSDDIIWCKSNLFFNFPTFFVGDEYSGENDEGHLILMAASRDFIIPTSTFSWWASWLGSREGKIVIAPKYWFSDKKINIKDLIPKNWVRM